MSLIRRRYVDAAAWPGPFDPVAVPPPEAAATRILLRRMICARDYGCDLDGTPYPAGDAAQDYLIAGINEAEARLRPHVAGLLR